MERAGSERAIGRVSTWPALVLSLVCAAAGCTHPDPDWTTLPRETNTQRRSPSTTAIQENEAMGFHAQLSPVEPRLGAFGWYWRIRIEPNGSQRLGAGFEFSVGPTVAWGRLTDDVTGDTRPVAWALLHGEPSFALRFAGRWFLRAGLDVRVMARRYPFHFNFAPTLALGATSVRRRVELAVSYEPVYVRRVHAMDGAFDRLGWAWFLSLRVDHSMMR